MIIETVDHGVVRSALELASRAPSVHNTQPWWWKLGDGSIHLYADLRRWLPATDPDGRDLLLSCGAWLHHLRVALAAMDIGFTVHRLPDAAEPDLLAVIELRPDGDDKVDSAAADEQADSIAVRRTDRRRFGNWPVPQAFVAQLVERAAEQGAVLRVVEEGAALETLFIAIRTAAVEHAGTAGYDAELTTWSGVRGSPDGVPAANVPASDARPGGPPTRRFAHGEMDDDGSTSPDAATVLVLGTSSDDRLSQLRAGEAMSAVLLQATTLGLGSSPYSEPLEVPGTRALLREEVLGGTLSPQMILRVGWPLTTGPVPSRTERLTLADQIKARPSPLR